MEATEVQRKEAVKKLEFIQNVISQVIKATEKGKVTSIPYEKMLIIEPAIKGLTSVNVKEYTVIFIRCPGEEIEEKEAFD